jgi:hypothetical protein
MNLFLTGGVLLSLAVLSAVPALAQEAGPVAQADTVSIFGHEYSVIPFQMEQPSLPWQDVKSCLPDSLKTPSLKPMTDGQVLQELEGRQTEAEERYGKLLEEASAVYAKAHPSLKLEAVEYRVASDSLKQSNPPSALYKAACENLALTYLHDMLYAKITPPPAPGGMPEP